VSKPDDARKLETWARELEIPSRQPPTLGWRQSSDGDQHRDTGSTVVADASVVLDQVEIDASVMPVMDGGIIPDTVCADTVL
jgi:hypothetical protein